MLVRIANDKKVCAQDATYANENRLSLRFRIDTVKKGCTYLEVKYFFGSVGQHGENTCIAYVHIQCIRFVERRLEAYTRWDFGGNVICGNGIVRLYSAVRERKSIEFSYGAYFSKKPGYRGSREKLRRFYQPNTSLDFPVSPLFPVASSFVFSCFSCSVRLLKTRLWSFCISRMPHCRLRQRTNAFGFLLIPLARATRASISTNVGGIAFENIIEASENATDRTSSDLASGIISFERFICAPHRIASCFVRMQRYPPNFRRHLAMFRPCCLFLFLSLRSTKSDRDLSRLLLSHFR